MLNRKLSSFAVCSCFFLFVATLSQAQALQMQSPQVVNQEAAQQSPELSNVAAPPPVDPVVSLISTIFRGNFAQAKALADVFIVNKPQDPMGYLLRGMANDWMQVVADKSIDEAIMADYQKAVELARGLVQGSPGNLDYQVLLGNSLMYAAKKHVDMGSKMKAGQVLKESSKIMESVIARDPSRDDAFFAIGMFNYFADNVPSGFKLLAALVGIKGDGEKGLSYIQKAAQSPTLTQMDAQYILFYIYSQKQGRYELAYNQAASLFQTYPENPLFWFDLAEMQMRTKKFAESHVLFDKFLKHCDAAPDRCRQKHRYLANFFNAWGYIDTNQYDLAKPFAIKAHELDTKVYKDRTKQIKGWYKTLNL